MLKTYKIMQSFYMMDHHSQDNSSKLHTNGKRRMPRCKTDDNYEGLKQRQRLGGGEFKNGSTTVAFGLVDKVDRNDVELISIKHHVSASWPCYDNFNRDLEQSIIRGVELMDLQSQTQLVLPNTSNPLNNCNEQLFPRHQHHQKYDFAINTKENGKMARKLKKVIFRNRQEDFDQKPFYSPENGIMMEESMVLKKENLTIPYVKVSNVKALAAATNLETLWQPNSLCPDDLVHRENISSAGTPPDGWSLASFEDLGSQMTDDIFVKSAESRRKRDVTDEEREDRIVKWLCTVRKMAEPQLFASNIRLS